MRAHQSDRAALHKRAHDSLRANAAILRVCTLQQLIQQKHQWRIVSCEIEDLAQPRDLGIETGTAFPQRIVDANAGAYLQRRQLQAGCSNAMASTTLIPMARSRVLLPDMLEPLTSRTRIAPHMLTLL